MGPETGIASTMRITIYFRVNNLIYFMFSAIIEYCRLIFCRYYGNMVPSLLSIMHGFGFCIMNSILGGQALGSLAPIGEK